MELPRELLAPTGSRLTLARGGAKMALQGTPIKYEGMAPSQDPFWLL